MSLIEQVRSGGPAEDVSRHNLNANARVLSYLMSPLPSWRQVRQLLSLAYFIRQEVCISSERDLRRNFTEAGGFV